MEIEYEHKAEDLFDKVMHCLTHKDSNESLLNIKLTS